MKCCHEIVHSAAFEILSHDSEMLSQHLDLQDQFLSEQIQIWQLFRISLIQKVVQNENISTAAVQLNLMVFVSSVSSLPFLNVLLSFCALWQKVEANICHFDHLCAFSVSVRLHVNILYPFVCFPATGLSSSRCSRSPTSRLPHWSGDAALDLWEKNVVKVCLKLSHTAGSYQRAVFSRAVCFNQTHLSFLAEPGSFTHISALFSCLLVCMWTVC